MIDNCIYKNLYLHVPFRFWLQILAEGELVGMLMLLLCCCCWSCGGMVALLLWIFLREVNEFVVTIAEEQADAVGADETDEPDRYCCWICEFIVVIDGTGGIGEWCWCCCNTAVVERPCWWCIWRFSSTFDEPKNKK